MLGRGLISMEFHTPTLKERLYLDKYSVLNIGIFFHIRVKTLKNTLRPNNEQNFDFRIFLFFHQVLKALFLYSFKECFFSNLFR